MSNDDSELSSDDLLRQAREAFSITPPSAVVPSLSDEVTIDPVDLAADDAPAPRVQDADPAAGLDSESLLSGPSAAAPSPPPASPTPARPIPAGLDSPMPPVSPPSSTQPPPPRFTTPTPGASSPPPPTGAPPVQRARPNPMPAAPQPRRVPMPPPSRQGSNIPWRLIIGGVVVGGFMLIGAISNRGTTGATQLGVGDCFADPGVGNISRVTDQDCAGPHEIQIYASVTGGFSIEDFDIDDFDPDDPSSLGTPSFNNASDKCDERLIEIMSSSHMADPSIVIPDDAVLAEFSDPNDQFGGEVLCAIESPSGGLVGSILP